MSSLYSVAMVLISIGVFTKNTNGQHLNYIIEGHILGLDQNSKVYLINASERKRIDSSVVRNNRFVLKGKVAEPLFTYLYSGKTHKMADILLDNRDIEVKGNQPIYDSVKITGSEIDAQWREWSDHDQKIGYQIFRLNKLSQSLLEKQDAEALQIVKELSEELVADRIALLKYYVRKYHHSASGALLPTLCTIQDKLKTADYLEMYHALTPPMRASQLGKEILTLANKTAKME